MTTRLSAMPIPVVAIDLDAVHAAEESCQIVSALGFYPEHKVGAEYVDIYTLVLAQRLRLTGARLAGVLNRSFHSGGITCMTNATWLGNSIIVRVSASPIC